MTTSTFPEIQIPSTSVYDYLFGDLDPALTDRVALIDGTTGDETTYGQLVARIDALAGALAERGVGIGTVVGLLCPNTPAFAIVFHGILRAGATVTTINSLYKPGEIENQLRDAGATWLFTVSPLLEGASLAATHAGLGEDNVIVLDGAPGHPSLTDLLSEGRTAPEVSFDPATHLAVLPYSSGTTGRPKGVMLTHRNLVANVEQSKRVIGVAETDRVLAVLPFFHIYGLTVLLNYALGCRASLVTMPASTCRNSCASSARRSAPGCSSLPRSRSRWPSIRWSRTSISRRSTSSSPAPPRSTEPSPKPSRSASAARCARATE